MMLVLGPGWAGWVQGTFVSEAVVCRFSGQPVGEEGEERAYCLQSPTGQSFAPLGINYPLSRWHGLGDSLCLVPHGNRAAPSGGGRRVLP